MWPGEGQPVDGSWKGHLHKCLISCLVLSLRWTFKIGFVYFYFMCIVCMYVCGRVSDLLKLDLQTFVSRRVCTHNCWASSPAPMMDIFNWPSTSPCPASWSMVSWGTGVSPLAQRQSSFSLIWWLNSYTTASGSNVLFLVRSIAWSLTCYWFPELQTVPSRDLALLGLGCRSEMIVPVCGSCIYFKPVVRTLVT